MGVPIARDKTFYAATILDFAGKQAIAVLDQKRRVTLRQLQLVIGLLNFACSVIVPGRAFLRRLIDLTIGLTKPYHHVRFNKEARADLAAWRGVSGQDFLSQRRLGS